MQIKRFEARDMTTALKLVKHELGPEAVILSARSLKVENRFLGSVKKAGVEVTAATDSYHSAASSNAAPYSGALSTDDSGGGVQQKIFANSVQNRTKSPAYRRPLPNYGNRRRRRNDDLLTGIFQHLLSQGVNRDVANDLIEFIKKEIPANPIDLKDKVISKITAALEQKRNKPGRASRTKAGPKVLAFIGPTGVGKTTAIAKLAAKQVIERNKKVALVNLDSYRIAATEELKIYAKAIGIPVKAAATPSAFAAAVNAYRQHDFIFVDTPGINCENNNEIDDLKSYLEAIGSIEIHLLLSAGTKEDDLFNTIECLRAIPIQHLILTKLDESTTFGNLINLLVDNQLPLSFLTTGRQVPDSIETGSVDKIVKCLFGSFMNHLGISNSGTSNQVHPTTFHGSAQDDYVANKNSDVFHCPDCKWTLKIKPKNMITFSSVQEAKTQHFVPCRDCQPAANDTVLVGTPRKDKIRISNYS
ncbi:MAG: flagellar biosynthesis protein FlhF [Desulfobacterales bacterium]|jgi:flagellar biosynthesis protein FlhF